MSDGLTLDDRGALASLGRTWWVLLFIGVVTSIIGLFLTFWTDKSISVIALFFGIYLLVSGIFQLVASFGVAENKALFAISGLLSIILAIYLFKAVHNDYSAEILALFIGISWLFRGVIELIVGLQSKGAEGRNWLIWGGLLLVLGAIAIFIWPSLVVGTLVTIAGIVLLIVGISEIVAAFQVKKLASA